MRLTLPALGPEHEARAAISSLLKAASQLAEDAGVRWFCLPLDLTTPGAHNERIASVLAGLRATPKMFVNCIVASERGVAPDAILDVAKLVLNVAKLSNNGFDNFRVGASCNCPPNAPFFPFSRHGGEQPAFSFALETTPLLQATLAAAPKGLSLTELRPRLVDALVPALSLVERLGHELQTATGVAYRGVDASLAPFPDGSTSIPGLFQSLTGCVMGAPGTLFTTAVLTDTLRAALEASRATPIGFNGVMFSVLEDERLAAANNRRALSIESLMAFSAVCGCGLDMIPVPFDTFPEEIAGAILDVAALSCRLSKPLGVRLLPIPGKSVNEYTHFNLDFLCDSRVMELKHTERTPVAEGTFQFLTEPTAGHKRTRRHHD